MNSENVKIPLALLNQAADVLEYICNSNVILTLAPDFAACAESALWGLKRKQRSVDLRTAYSKIVNAKTEDDRHSARIDYLRLRETSDYPF